MRSRASRYPPSERWLAQAGVWSGLVLAGAVAGRSFRPSLMPRSTANQALVTGTSSALGYGLAAASYRVGARTGSDVADLAVLTAGVAGGVATSRSLTEADGEARWRPIVRTSASCVAAGSSSAMVGVALRNLPPTWRRRVGFGLTSLAVLSGTREIVRGVRAQREAHTPYDPPPPRPLPAVVQSVGVAGALGTLAVGFARTSGVLAGVLERRVGVAPVTARWLGRSLSVATWAVVGRALADLFVRELRLYDRVLDTAFDRAPASTMRSAGPGSPVPFARLGREGRRFVLNVASADDIAAVMGRSAVAEPIRVYAGYASGRSDEERVALALDELRRTGAFDRSLIVVGCPAGNGLIDSLPLEVLDLVLLGDTAAVGVQYGRLPSFLTLRRTTRGARVQRALLEGIRDELAARPPGRRPTVVVYGESLGAWAGQDTFLHGGLDGFDELGVDRALWAGTPFYSGWRREVLVERTVAVPEGSVREIERAEELEHWSGADRSRLRALVIGHGNDPVCHLAVGLLVRRPPWMRGRRPWGVPADMGWLPGITAVQVIVDAVNASRPTPGVFRATGHEYKADLPLATLVAYGVERPDEATWGRVLDHLRAADADRATRGRLPEPRAGAAENAADGPRPGARRPHAGFLRGLPSSAWSMAQRARGTAARGGP